MCTVVSFDPALSAPDKKACPGTCGKGSCKAAPKVWVVAAAEGRITLFERTPIHSLNMISRDGQHVFPSAEAFQQALRSAQEERAFDQLIIVAGARDIPWVQMCLPEYAQKRVAAEIVYPLMPAWFLEEPTTSKMTAALEILLRD